MRLVFLVIVLALVVVTAGCAGDAPGDGANDTTEEQVTEPPVETTAEPTAEPTEAPPETDESTEAPPQTEGPGDGGDGDTGDADSDNRTILLIGALAVFAIGFVAAGILRGRRKSEPRASTPSSTPTEEPRSDAERVVSLLHKNNGRMFEDVLEEELDWSPAHARRVVDGLVATGDVERRETDGGTLVVFTDPTRTTEEQ